MEHETFDEVVERRIDDLRKRLTTKGAEYAGTADRFHNFQTASQFQGQHPAQICWNFLVKHLVSIQDMVGDVDRNSTVQFNAPYDEEKWDEKIGDAIAYLCLLYGIALEDIEAAHSRIQAKYAPTKVSPSQPREPFPFSDPTQDHERE